jgi:hypothetical protein
VVTAPGYAAGGSAEIYLHSDPVLLATVNADAGGVVRATITIPTSATAGAHSIEVRGTAPSGSPRSLSTAFTVSAATAAATGTPAAATPTTSPVSRTPLSRTGRDLSRLTVIGLATIALGVVVKRRGRLHRP